MMPDDVNDADAPKARQRMSKRSKREATDTDRMLAGSNDTYQLVTYLLTKMQPAIWRLAVAEGRADVLRDAHNDPNDFSEIVKELHDAAQSAAWVLLEGVEHAARVRKRQA